MCQDRFVDLIVNRSMHPILLPDRLSMRNGGCVLVGIIVGGLRKGQCASGAQQA